MIYGSKMAFKLYFGPAGKPIGFRGTVAEAIEYLAKMGLDAMEVQQVRGFTISVERAKIIREVSQQHKFILSMHAPYAINLSSDKAETIEKSKERLLKAAELAHIMGASPVVLHPGYYGKKEKDKALKLVIDGLKEVVEKMKSKKISVKIGIETTGKVSQVGSIDEVIQIVREVPMTVPVIDFAHIHARTGGTIKTHDDYLNVIRRIENELGTEYVKHLHIHFSEIEFGLKGEKRHLPLGSGTGPKFEILAELLIDLGYEAVIICETPLLEKDAIKMKQIALGIFNKKKN